MKQIKIIFLAITGKQNSYARVDFINDLNVIYGASNTGKSFILKAVDFMLGAEKLKKKIPELKGYERFFLGITLEGKGNFTLERSIKAGDYNIYNGFIDPLNIKEVPELQLKASHKDSPSLSNFILEYLGWNSKKLAKNQFGETQSLTIRDLAFLSLTDEANIQSEISPLLKGDVISLTPKKSFFRYLLSSIDDSNIISVVDDKTFKINKKSKISVYQEILNDIDKTLLNQPPEEELQDQLDKLERFMDEKPEDLNKWQQAINKNLKNKMELSIKLQDIEGLIGQTKVHLQRFNTLNNIYISDIERLNFIEEAGHLTLLKKQEICFSCGSLIPETSKQKNETNIKNDVIAALAEIEKINIMRTDLHSSIEDLKLDLKVNQEIYSKTESEILKIDNIINNLKLSLDNEEKDFKKIINQRDTINQALNAYTQKRLYSIRLAETEAYKKPSKDAKPNLEISSFDLNEFCKYVSSVLIAWKFPGECKVNFDTQSFDIQIDSQDRISNGKGVRALTHAAFKVAIMLYCRTNNLPHPGFMILDTPLLAYRDPIEHRGGELTDDEKEIANKSIKDAFFGHLLTISNLCQFIVIENIDPPVISKEFQESVKIIQFTGVTEQGRKGFFPASKS